MRANSAMLQGALTKALRKRAKWDRRIAALLLEIAGDPATVTAAAPALSKLALAIREERKRHKLNQRAFASLLGVTQSAVAQWETDKTSPSAMALTSIGKLPGADENYWFKQTGRYDTSMLTAGSIQ